MAKVDAAQHIAEDLETSPGTGATQSVGSDSYPYWVTEVLPNGVYGICRADSHFDEAHPWEGGVEVVEPYDPATCKTEMHIKRCYGNWWVVSRDGKRLRRFTDKYVRFSIGSAVAYSDPSF